MAYFLRQSERDAVPSRAAAEPELAQRDVATAIAGSPRVTAQRRAIEQLLGHAPRQRRKICAHDSPLQARSGASRGGLPGPLRAGMEALSGMDLSDVRVHRDSAQPAQLNALAYAQGNDIHLAPGQERHLSHEAWHVVQQRQGRVQPTMQMGSIAINDDQGLEAEADAMGSRAAQMKVDATNMAARPHAVRCHDPGGGGSSPHVAAQRRLIESLFGDADGQSPRSPMQLRKITEPTQSDKHLWWVQQYDETEFVPTNLVPPAETPAFKAKAIWDKGVAIYTASEARGLKLENQLADVVGKFKDDTPIDADPSPRAALLESKRTKNTAADKTFADQYESTVPVRESADAYRVNSTGFDTARPVVSDAKYGGDYSNTFDVTGGSVKAEWNMAASVDDKDWSVTIDDKARAAGKGLQNSDILWRQARLAAMKHFEGDGEQQRKANEALANLTRIQRDTIINKETVLTVFMAYPDDVAWNSAETFQPGTSEFRAILGTPNANSSAHFLMDNIGVLGKTFRDITATASGGLDINFKQIP